MNPSGKLLGPPLLGLLLAAVIAVAASSVPERPQAPLSASRRTAEQPTEPPRIFVNAPDLLSRAAEAGLEAVLPPTGSAYSLPSAPGFGRSFVRERQTPTRVLSDREIFAILHPSYYLRYLGLLEDLMIQDGQMKPSEKQVFDSEDKVIDFLRDRVFNYMVLKSIAAPGDRGRFERGLEIVQDLHRTEASYLRYGIRASRYKTLAFWAPVVARINRAEPGSALSLLRFFVPSALAQADGGGADFGGGVDGGAEGAGECFQSGVGTPAVQGSNLGAPCCDCTINGVPVGCLNSVCEGQPAIFDTTFFICGCDTPSGGEGGGENIGGEGFGGAF